MPHHPIITVAANKGGVGKTTVAFELAASLDGILIDLDWDGGGATGMWGAHADHHGARLLEGLTDGRVPRPLRAPGRPRLVASHPDLGVNEYDATEVADRLAAWASSWDAPVVIDTHPGAVPITFGAISAATVVVVPVVLRERELAALAAFLPEFQDYPVVLVPSMVPPIPPARQLEKLEKLANDHRVHVSPAISQHPWLARRLARRAVTLVADPGKATKTAADQFRAVAEFAERYASRAASLEVAS